MSASADGDTAYVAGTRCTSGKLNGDTSACLHDTGVSAFTLTGGTSGAVIVYSVENGWSVVQSDDGARTTVAVPSWGSGILLSRMGMDDLVRIDESGKRRTVHLPDSSVPIAGIGDAVLVRNGDGKPEVVDAARRDTADRRAGR